MYVNKGWRSKTKALAGSMLTFIGGNSCVLTLQKHKHAPLGLFNKATNPTVMANSLPKGFTS